ncbi:hypothetical protein ASZ90_017452 [hydrocarbon metagenome]|uniref:Uncharacterized protein n=1 Tax=hydrocarbon metagenome TaxID=938273 RepID=A0A0W8E916_9ZZZZ
MDIHQRLTEAAQSLQEYNKLQSRLESSIHRLSAAKEHRDALYKSMLDEGRDLERLDGVSLLNLWHSLRATKDETRHKEIQEYHTARFKYEEADSAVKTLEAEIEQMKNDLKSQSNAPDVYQGALKAKEEFLLTSSSPSASLLCDMDEKLGSLEAGNSELQEAIQAGQISLEELSKVAKSLNSSSGWGALDILGGGLLITAVKHSRINDAKKELKQAQASLQRFQRELADVQLSDTIDITRISTAADFLLDGLLFDVIVQSQINTARKQTRQTIDQVQMLIEGLQKMLLSNYQHIQELGMERNKIIETG